MVNEEKINWQDFNYVSNQHVLTIYELPVQNYYYQNYTELYHQNSVFRMPMK